MPTTNRVRIVNFGAFLGIWGVWIAVTTDPNDIPKGFLDQLRLCYGTIPIGILAAMIAISFEAAGRDHEWVPALLFIIVVLGVYADLILDNMAAPLANLLYKTFTIMSLGQTHERFVLYIVYCLLCVQYLVHPLFNLPLQEILQSVGLNPYTGFSGNGKLYICLWLWAAYNFHEEEVKEEGKKIKRKEEKMAEDGKEDKGKRKEEKEKKDEEDKKDKEDEKDKEVEKDEDNKKDNEDEKDEEKDKEDILCEVS